MEEQKPFWMVYGAGQRAPEYRHDTRESAENEAKRLARFNPGIRFFVLETIAVAEKIEVQFTRIMRREINKDEIPF